jgi:tetratricopeptide (TPR) repeat protein
MQICTRLPNREISRRRNSPTRSVVGSRAFSRRRCHRALIRFPAARETSMTGDVVRFPSPRSSLSPGQGLSIAHELRRLPISDRLPTFSEQLGEPEVLLALCQVLDKNLEAEPARVIDDAEFLYRHLESRPENESGCLFDEREYFLGELALIAGIGSRVLAHREHARMWLDRAEAWFLLTSNSPADLSRVAYQRLAVKIEEGRFEEVLRTVEPVKRSLERARSTESILKCRILQAIAYKETNQLERALTIFKDVLKEARLIASERLVSSCYVNSVQIHAMRGETDAAAGLVNEALPLLRATNNRKDLAKLQWGVANLLRVDGRTPLAIDAFRVAQKEFVDLEMPGDVAAIQLVIADLLLELGQEAQAEWEIRAALPVIDELKMVPEGVAALSLLRESVRRRKIDRQALRDLHGYFDEIQG